MNIDRSLKIGIISSVVATFLFIYLLDPILRLVTFILFNVLGSAARWYTDRLFEQAALLVGPDPSLYVLSMLVGLGCGVLSSATISIAVWRLKDREAPSRRWLKKIPPRLVRGIMAVVAVVTLLFLLLILHSTMFGLRITSSFNQHVAAVAPFIPDQEVKVLRSRWTQMRNERDYRGIYIDLEGIAKRNHVKLPENKVYSFSSL